MDSNPSSTEVKVEHDIESFKAEIISRMNIVLRDFDAFLDQVDPKMAEIYQMMVDYPNRQELREAFPPRLLIGSRVHRKPRHGNSNTTLVGTFWAPECLNEL